MTAQGAIAMTCTPPPREAQEHFGILIWTFALMMHPEFILDAQSRSPALSLMLPSQILWWEAAAMGRLSCGTTAG